MNDTLPHIKATSTWLLRSTQILAILLISSCTSAQIDSEDPQESEPSYKDRLALLVADSSLYDQMIVNTDSFGLKGYEGDSLSANIDTTIAIESHFDYSAPHYTSLSFWPDQKELKSSLPNNTGPLTGVKIALDAGHLGKNIEEGKRENKFVQFGKDSDPRLEEDISFHESNLTLVTALILQDSLTKLGADVFLTRHDNSGSCFGVTYEEWKTKHVPESVKWASQHQLISSKDSALFIKLKDKDTDLSNRMLFQRLYNKLDVIYRSRLINEFEPDLTMIIHYNVDVNNSEWIKPSDDNYSMAFVPGGFCAGELYRSHDRHHFLRLLTGPDFDKSIDLCAAVIDELETTAGIEPISEPHNIGYLNKYTVFTQNKGVYARNLLLTREIRGVMCYAEPLCQDNIKESIVLNKRDISIENFQSSSRTITIAHSYQKAIVSYVENRVK